MARSKSSKNIEVVRLALCVGDVGLLVSLRPETKKVFKL